MENNFEPMTPPAPPVQTPPAPKRFFNKDMILVAAAVLAVVVMVTLLLTKTGIGAKIPFLNFGKQAVAQKAVDFLNANSGTYLQGQTATLGTVSLEKGLVKFQLKIGESSYDSYVTRDGSLLFPNSIKLDESVEGQPAGQTVNASKVNIAGVPFIGAENAPAVMVFWSDYQCPFCKKTVDEVFPQLIKEYVDTGKVKVVFKDYAFLGTDSYTLAKFARAVWEGSPVKFGAWHITIYANQGQEHSGWATEAKIMEITTKAIGSADAKKALALFKKNGDAYQKLADADKAEGTSFGVDGTPGTIIGKQFINGAEPYASFKAAIDKALAEK